MVVEPKKVTVLEVLKDFWIECEITEQPLGSIRQHLIDLGYDPDALSRRIELMVAEARAKRIWVEKTLRDTE